jgi:hypothetical protein
VRALALSVVLHALVAWWLWPRHAARVVRPPVREVEQPPTLPDPEPIEVAMLPEPTVVGHAGGGHGGAVRGGHAVHADPWGELSIGVEGGTGSGTGDGRGGGIGFGEGGGIATSAAVPPPPPPPPPSHARPAKLLRPARDVEVIDDSYLFVARVTVDEDGDVAAVHMVTTHPGLRGDQAASAIWTFHYAPALDDAGTPIRSTFEQPFQVR